MVSGGISGVRRLNGLIMNLEIDWVITLILWTFTYNRWKSTFLKEVWNYTLIYFDKKNENRCSESRLYYHNNDCINDRNFYLPFGYDYFKIIQW